MRTTRTGHGSSLKNFVALWMGALGVCVLFLSVFLVISTDSLQHIARQIYDDSSAMESIRAFESDVNAIHRLVVLGRKMPDEVRLDARVNKLMADARGNIRDLGKTVTTKEERHEYDALEDSFFEFRDDITGAARPSPSEVDEHTEKLLRLTAEFYNDNKHQMMATLASSRRINIYVNRAVAASIVLMALIMLGGAAGVINRVFQPVFSLTDSARRFGRGDFSARSRVFHDDELGALCETFNAMAESLESIHKDREAFVATMVHDLKNPLAVVGAAAYRIRKSGNLDEKQDDMMRRIGEQVVRIETMITDMLDTVSIEAGNVQLRTRLVDMDELLKEFHASTGGAISSHEISCEATGSMLVEGDPRLLERVFANLVSNAVKYSPEGTVVRIAADRFGNFARVMVTDEGAGITPEEAEELFKPFNRLPRTSNLAAGTGLGLYSVKRIVEAHGGKISIRGGIEKGTAVVVLLPLVSANGRGGALPD